MATSPDSADPKGVKEIRRHGNATHGMTNTTEFHIWTSIKLRCLNTNYRDYPKYGGRGINICKAWTNSFEAFYRDMGPRPTGLQIERVDNDGPYCKSNCRWATRKEQARNRRSNRKLTHKDETLTIAEWTERMGFKKNVIRNRLVAGWSIADAIETDERLGCAKIKTPPQ